MRRFMAVAMLAAMTVLAACGGSQNQFCAVAAYEDYESGLISYDQYQQQVKDCAPRRF